VKLSIFARMTLSISLAVFLMTSVASTSSGMIDSDLKLPEKEWVDGTYMRNWKTKTMDSYPSSSINSGLSDAYPPENMNLTVSDFGLNIDYNQTFRWVMTGEHCYIYVAYDLAAPYYNYYDASNDQYVFVNPNYPTGAWSTEDRISTAQLKYLMDEFDNSIYPKMTSIFGFPNERPAGETKIYILIMNIRDESYYDSTIEWYVAGYFSWGEDAVANKNMIHIDSFDWTNRIGPDVARPYVYESTFTHEFEHLIHNDIDAGEESWVDEGLADLASYFCGYGHETGHIAYYLVYHPFVSLTFFGGGLENYGASYLFQLYLYEKFGGQKFIVDLVHNQLHGIEGIEDTLKAHGYMISFEQIFQNWAIANYIDDLSFGDGEYGYLTLDIPSKDTLGYSIEYALHNYWQGREFNRGTYMESSMWYGAAPQPYTAQYWNFAFTPVLQEASFQCGGDEFSGVPAYSGDYHWYAGMGNWVWRKLGQTFSIPMSGAKLDFWTYYEIETDWDYAYVEVHDLTTDTWTTLPGLKTTTTLPHVQDNPNTPADREPGHYFDQGKWNALTGFSNGYYQEQMDLSAFAGHNIELNFVYWTDGAYNEQGIYIDDISIPELGFFDDVEAGTDGWTTDGWIRTKQTDWPNNWEGAVIDLTLPGTTLPGYRNPSFRTKIRYSKMIPFEQALLKNVWTITDGSLTISAKDVYNRGREHIFVAIFWNAVPHILRGDYWFQAN